MSEDHVITILYNIICSLKYLHSANILHRDIKPDNLLVDSTCTITFADFGLSRALNESDDEKILGLSRTAKKMRKNTINIKSDNSEDRHSYKSRMSTILINSRSQRKERSLSDHMCSRWYRAPEIILMEKKYDQGIDMWPIGCILEELIYCSEPYVKDLSDS